LSTKVNPERVAGSNAIDYRAAPGGRQRSV